MISYNLVLPNFEVAPKDVRIWDALPPIVSVMGISNKVYLISEVCSGVGGGGTYPATGHVRAPDAYGPTGIEYTGTETLPAEPQVQLGVGYGENGTEFTGTMAGSGGHKRVRMIS